MGPILSKTGTLKTTKETDKNKTMTKKKKKETLLGAEDLYRSICSLEMLGHNHINKNSTKCGSDG